MEQNYDLWVAHNWYGLSFSKKALVTDLWGDLIIKPRDTTVEPA